MGQNMTERFYRKIRVNATTGCHEWIGALSQKGYGRFHFKRKNRHAHRIAWELARGPIPDGLWVLHKCDNPPCCNPDHLFLGASLYGVSIETIKAVQYGRTWRHI